MKLSKSLTISFAFFMSLLLSSCETPTTGADFSSNKPSSNATTQEEAKKQTELLEKTLKEDNQNTDSQTFLTNDVQRKAQQRLEQSCMKIDWSDLKDRLTDYHKMDYLYCNCLYGKYKYKLRVLSNQVSHQQVSRAAETIQQIIDNNSDACMQEAFDLLKKDSKDKLDLKSSIGKRKFSKRQKKLMSYEKRKEYNLTKQKKQDALERRQAYLNKLKAKKLVAANGQTGTSTSPAKLSTASATKPTPAATQNVAKASSTTKTPSTAKQTASAKLAASAKFATSAKPVASTQTVANK